MSLVWRFFGILLDGSHALFVLSAAMGGVFVVLILCAALASIPPDGSRKRKSASSVSRRDVLLEDMVLVGDAIGQGPPLCCAPEFLVLVVSLSQSWLLVSDTGDHSTESSLFTLFEIIFSETPPHSTLSLSLWRHQDSLPKRTTANNHPSF